MDDIEPELVSPNEEDDEPLDEPCTKKIKLVEPISLFTREFCFCFFHLKCCVYCVDQWFSTFSGCDPLKIILFEPGTPHLLGTWNLGVEALHLVVFHMQIL